VRLTTLHRIVTRAVSPRAAGVARILVGIACLLKALEVAPALVRLQDPATLRLPILADVPTLADLPSSLVILAWVAAAATFAVGIRTGWAGIALAAILAGVLVSDQQLYSNHLYLLTLLVGLLTIGRAGAAISGDARLGRGRSEIPVWPLQLIRIQVSIVYFFAAVSKLNAAYLSGSVVAMTLRTDGPLALPEGFRTFEVMFAASLLAILLELFLAAALWLPRWRRTAFVIGLGMHLGIAVWMEPTLPLALFALVILSPYILFLDAPPGSRAVVWDDSCEFCRGSVRLLTGLDWLHAIRWVPGSQDHELAGLGVRPEEADRALQLVGPRRRSGGFAAITGILEVTPVAFLWAPLLRLPPVAGLGELAYRRVAERRKCRIALPRAAETPGEFHAHEPGGRG
jgi:predicted DCC family thiol-disulfide oxidoreductase YuxK